MTLNILSGFVTSMQNDRKHKRKQNIEQKILGSSYRLKRTYSMYGCHIYTACHEQNKQSEIHRNRCYGRWTFYNYTLFYIKNVVFFVVWAFKTLQYNGTTASLFYNQRKTEIAHLEEIHRNCTLKTDSCWYYCALNSSNIRNVSISNLHGRKFHSNIK